jgi:hypothetical protein
MGQLDELTHTINVFWVDVCHGWHNELALLSSYGFDVVPIVSHLCVCVYLDMKIARTVVFGCSFVVGFDMLDIVLAYVYPECLLEKHVHLNAMGHIMLHVCSMDAFSITFKMKDDNDKGIHLFRRVMPEIQNRMEMKPSSMVDVCIHIYIYAYIYKYVYVQARHSNLSTYL